MPYYRLGEAPYFPDPELAEPDGLIAVGGDLSPERLLMAYASGIFPWYSEADPILWWSPDPRLILRADRLRVSRSLAKTLRRGTFELRFDTAFEAVLKGCAGPRRGDEELGPGTWLISEVQQAYLRLHQLGLAHSVETWSGGELVGGLYGVFLGRMFCGESMFSRVPDASKVALVGLFDYLKTQNVEVVDCQLATDHLLSMGAQELSRREFLAMLDEALQFETDLRPWTWPPPAPLPPPARAAEQQPPEDDSDAPS